MSLSGTAGCISELQQRTYHTGQVLQQLEAGGDGVCGAAQVMYRERAAGMYSELPFASAQCLVEVPYNLAQALLFSAISYFMLGFDHNAGDSLGPDCLSAASSMQSKSAQAAGADCWVEGLCFARHCPSLLA